MLLKLFLLFLIVPVIEIWLIVQSGHLIGLLPTLAILLLISLLGAFLGKSQGLRVVQAIQADLAAGRLPAAHLLDGALILAGSILLLTPGFFTDVAGLFFLFPLTRKILKQWARVSLERALLRGTIHIHRR